MTLIIATVISTGVNIGRQKKTEGTPEEPATFGVI